MLFVAWFSLIIYIISCFIGLIRNVQNNVDPFAIMFSGIIQSAIIWCLIVLILLL